MESIDRLKKYVDDNTDKTAALTMFADQSKQGDAQSIGQPSRREVTG